MKAKKGMKGKAMKGMAMKAKKAVAKGRSVSKGELCTELEATTGVKKSDCTKVVKGLEEIIPALLKKTGKVNLPGIARVVIRHKKATKAGKRMMFGQEVKVAAKPARKVVKAFPAKVLKDQF